MSKAKEGKWIVFSLSLCLALGFWGSFSRAPWIQSLVPLSAADENLIQAVRQRF